MNHYLVSYIDPSTAATGNCEMNLPSPIRDMDDVQAVGALLREHYNLTKPIVMGFSRFENQEGR